MTQETHMDQPNPLVPGQIVRSKAGHDKGTVFLVLEIADAKHVWVTNGAQRPLARPKKKRVMHLQPYRDKISGIETMKQDTSWNDAKVRELLAPYTGNRRRRENVIKRCN